MRKTIDRTTCISTCVYAGDPAETLKLFAGACYVVASRFHSMVLAMAYDKPVFPISYNCKTINYLNDLNFKGKLAKLEQLAETSVDDVLYNYNNNIITDCSMHKAHSSEQFSGVRTFLNSLNEK